MCPPTPAPSTPWWSPRSGAARTRAYRDKIDFFLYRSPEFTGRSLTEIEARVGYQWNGQRHEVAVLGRNLLDRVQVIGAVDFNNFTGFYNEPRVLGVELAVSL